MTNKTQKGFTLVELIVVIAIIAVLAGVLVLAINPATLLAKGRDAKRLDDLDTLNKALSLALVDGEITLTAVSAPVGGQAADCTTGWVRCTIPTGKTGLSTKVATLPLDPLNTAPNVYTYGATTTAYELNAVMESPDNAAKMTTDGGNNATAYEVGTSLSVLP